MSTIHSRIPPSPLRPARAKNGQPGYSDLLLTPAANAATMADYVDGLGDYGMPPNPSGDYGHDHSGGYFGKPIFRSLFTSTLHGAQGETGVVYPKKHYQLYIENKAGGVTNTEIGPSIPLWIPNCPMIDGAYVSLGVRMRISIVSTTLTASDTLQIIVNLSQNSYTFAVSSPNTTGERYIGSASASETVNTVPGATNEAFLTGKAIRASGGSLRGCVINVHELELGVYST